jgi:hypothetical protein
LWAVCLLGIREVMGTSVVQFVYAQNARFARFRKEISRVIRARAAPGSGKWQFTDSARIDRYIRI